MKNLKLILTIVVIVSITGMFLWFGKTNKYQSVWIKRGAIKNIVTSSGSLTAEKKANLAFNKVGRISYLPVKVNDEIKKWQLVVSLDRSDLAAVREKELKDYLDARWDFEQTTLDDYKDTALTETIRRTKEKSQFALDRSVTDVEIADRAIKNASLYAPFDGVVTQVNGEVNEWTSAFSTEPLVQIVDFSTIYFEAEVDQEYVGNVKVGQKATVKLDAYPNREFVGEIYKKERVVKKTEEGDKVVMVKIKLQDLPADISLGLEGDAEIILEEKETLIIPKKVVERREGKAYVRYKVSNLSYKQKEIKLGIFDGINFEVLDGIGEGEYVWFR